MESSQSEKEVSAEERSKSSGAHGIGQTILRLIWGEPRFEADGSVVQIERAVDAIRGFSILGLIPVMAYGALAGYCDLTSDECTISPILKSISIALLTATAAFSVGGLFGFLFGVPRWGDGAVPLPIEKEGNSQDSNTNPNGTEADTLTQQKVSLNRSELSRVAPARDARIDRVRPNTGLEKVMDWLTTLIVGLGLVHIRTAIDYAKAISGHVTEAIEGPSNAGLPENIAGGAAILLPYLIAGFFLVYLWAQRYWGKEMALADMESNSLALERAKREMKKENEVTKKVAKEESRLALAEVANLATQLLERGQAGVSYFNANPLLQDGRSDIASSLTDVSPALTTEIKNRYSGGKDWNYEPMRGFGPDETQGRRLIANVERMSGSTLIYRIHLHVYSTDVEKPLTKPVFFMLHHTFADPIRTAFPEENHASLTILSGGSFIVGALVKGEEIRLSLDLAALPGVPQDFRDK